MRQRLSVPAAWLAASLLSAIGPALAQTRHGDAERGHHLAETFCAQCHLIAPNLGGSWTDAPPFPELARDPKRDQAWFRRFVQQPHWHMMGTNRSQPEADDLAAYFTTLRQ